MLINIIICICAQLAKELAVNFECPIIFCILLLFAEGVGSVESEVKSTVSGLTFVYALTSIFFPALALLLVVVGLCHNSMMLLNLITAIRESYICDKKLNMLIMNG